MKPNMNNRKSRVKFIGIVLLITGLMPLNGKSQNSIAQTFALGDSIHNFVLTDVINYKTRNISISDFKGTPLILDFWATWCAPCIKGLPKLDSLQRAYAGKLQIFLITSEDIASIKKFYKHLNEVKSLMLPIFCDTGFVLGDIYHIMFG
jgi:thiol-disulfide isomerase/thioredoxin